MPLHKLEKRLGVATAGITAQQQMITGVTLGYTDRHFQAALHVCAPTSIKTWKTPVGRPVVNCVYQKGTGTTRTMQ